MKNFIKSAAFKAVAFVALFLAGIMIYAASTGGAATIPEAITGAVVTPLQTAGAAISGGFQSFIGLFTDSGRFKKENAALQSQINELRDQQIELDNLREQNEFYKKYLEVKEQHSDFKFADGRVIYVDAADKYYNFTINIGSVNGVKENDPVITPEGLVGVVYKAGLNYSKVRTILDPASKVTAYVSRTRESGVTGGTLSLAQEGKMRLNYLSREGGTASGDMVVSSGKGGVYPSDLKIGTIESITPESDALTMYAVIKPFADIKNITSVFVITSFSGQGETIE